MTSGTQEAATEHNAHQRPGAMLPLAAVDAEAWRALATRAVEPNGYYLAEWERAVNASATGRTHAHALTAWSAAPSRLIGLLPVISGWRALRLPLPLWVSASPYGTLNTPLLDGRDAPAAIRALLDQARDAGARALLLRDMALEGAAMAALRAVLETSGIAPLVLRSVQRASLDATRDAEDLLRDGLGAKKLKELRRQRARLADAHGEVTFAVASGPQQVAAALEGFLTLEAGGWKGKRGTALTQDPGDAAFIRRAVPALAANGQCEMIALQAGATPVAAGIVLRHLDRAFYFKIGIDERFAKFSPGVQLTLELTRHLCADPTIATADSTAAPGHPMIDPIWRERLAIGDVLIPLRQGDAMVKVIHAALKLRQRAEDLLRSVIRKVRG